MSANSSQMSFMEHLVELRVRLLRACYGLLAATLICYFFSEFLFTLLLQPMLNAWREAGLGTPKIHFANPLEPFVVYLKTSLIGGVLLGSPVVFYQLWKFIAPGLYAREKKYVLPFTFFSAVCFIGGACFGYFFVFPIGFRFFLSFARATPSAMQNFGGLFTATIGQPFEVTPTLMMSEYFTLSWQMLLAFGIVFELPVILVFLGMIGLVTPKQLWRWNPYFIVLATIIGGILTPPDVISQLMMAVPMIVLYNLSILLTILFSRRTTS